MTAPLVSVIMPAYNCGETIASAVLSVVNQRHTAWELVIIDDGSPADFTGVIHQFDDDRIRLVRLAENGGVARALNCGLNEARGRFVARMDADDVMEEWRLGAQLDYLVVEGLAFCGTGANKFGAETGLIVNAVDGRAIIDCFFAGNPFVHPTMLFDREQLGGRLRYDETLACDEDYELWARLAEPGNCGNLPMPCLRYRVRPDGNANHPDKPRCNRLALSRFAERMGVAALAPVAALSELQMSGFVTASGWRAMRAYALAAEGQILPQLGFLQGALLAYDNYIGFMRWLDDHQLRNFAERADEPALFADV